MIDVREIKTKMFDETETKPKLMKLMTKLNKYFPFPSRPTYDRCDQGYVICDLQYKTGSDEEHQEMEDKYSVKNVSNILTALGYEVDIKHGDIQAMQGDHMVHADYKRNVPRISIVLNDALDNFWR